MRSTLHRIVYVWKSILEAQDIIVNCQRTEMETWEKKSNENIGGLQDTNTETPQPIELAHQP